MAIRAAGLVVWYLLIAEVMVGTMMSGNVATRTVPYRRKERIHHTVSWLLLIAIASHVGLILNQHYGGWSVQQTLVMGPGAVARNTGIAAAWVTLGVVVAATCRPLMSHLNWVTIHRTVPFAALAFGTVHGLLAGGHGTSLPVILPAVAALTLLLSIFIVRWNATRSRAIRRARYETKDRRTGADLAAADRTVREPQHRRQRKRRWFRLQPRPGPDLLPPGASQSPEHRRAGDAVPPERPELRRSEP